jgi:ABC-type transport system involved in cytochrome bd biosynthesis fused ATPase/permease subunit
VLLLQPCEQVQAALERAGRGRTVVVVAHRLATVRTADLIVVISEGRIAEQGTHQQLAAANGHYAAMLRRERNSSVTDSSSTDSSTTVTNGDAQQFSGRASGG